MSLRQVTSANVRIYLGLAPSSSLTQIVRLQHDESVLAIARPRVKLLSSEWSDIETGPLVRCRTGPRISEPYPMVWVWPVKWWFITGGVQRPLASEEVGCLQLLLRPMDQSYESLSEPLLNQVGIPSI